MVNGVSKNNNAWRWAAVLALAALLGWLGMNYWHAWARDAKVLHYVKTIGLGCKLYATDHEGNYPRTLAGLVPKYLPDEIFIHSPLRPLGEDYEFEYFGGTETDNPDKILIRGRLPGGQWVILHSDQSGWIASNPTGARK